MSADDELRNKAFVPTAFAVLLNQRDYRAAEGFGHPQVDGSCQDLSPRGVVLFRGLA